MFTLRNGSKLFKQTETPLPATYERLEEAGYFYALQKVRKKNEIFESN